MCECSWFTRQLTNDETIELYKSKTDPSEDSPLQEQINQSTNWSRCAKTATGIVVGTGMAIGGGFLFVYSFKGGFGDLREGERAGAMILMLGGAILDVGTVIYYSCCPRNNPQT